MQAIKEVVKHARAFSSVPAHFDRKVAVLGAAGARNRRMERGNTYAAMMAAVCCPSASK